MLCGLWDLPGPGIEPMSPALAGGFLTIGPPRISDSVGLVGGGVARIDHCDMSTDSALETSPRRQISLQELKKLSGSRIQLQCRRPQINSWVRKIPWRRDRLSTPVYLGLAQTVKNLPAVRETWVQSLSWEVPLEEGMATHSSILACRIPMDRGAWWATVHGVAKSQTRLSD